MSPIAAWAAAFVFTELVETPIYARALRDRDEGPGGPGGPGGSGSAALASLGPALAVAFAASAITHPVVWFVMPRLLPGDYLTMVAVAEAFAVVTEAVWLRAFGLRRALLWALFANAASLSLGLLSRRLLGFP